MGTENKFWQDAAQQLHDCINHMRLLDPTGLKPFKETMTPEKLQTVLKQYQGPNNKFWVFAQMSKRTFANVFWQWEHDVLKAERNSPS
ncbi:hypothetical protein ACTRXD_00405 [Nitrospira sp. T9]|uniref:hypothetical protein n=1 Tax=unclassified Nitrospira TaxID=2652172 RepID=UPI003F94794F